MYTPFGNIVGSGEINFVYLHDHWQNHSHNHWCRAKVSYHNIASILFHSNNHTSLMHSLISLWLFPKSMMICSNSGPVPCDVEGCMYMCVWVLGREGSWLSVLDCTSDFPSQGPLLFCGHTQCSVAMHHCYMFCIFGGHASSIHLYCPILVMRSYCSWVSHIIALVWWWWWLGED